MDCDKISFDSPKDAQDNLSGLRQRNRRDKFAMYKCSLCGHYHIATISKRTMRRIKKDKYPIGIPCKVERKQNNKSKKKKK